MLPYDTSCKNQSVSTTQTPSCVHSDVSVSLGREPGSALVCQKRLEQLGIAIGGTITSSVRQCKK